MKENGSGDNAIPVSIDVSNDYCIYILVDTCFISYEHPHMSFVVHPRYKGLCNYDSQRPIQQNTQRTLESQQYYGYNSNKNINRRYKKYQRNKNKRRINKVMKEDQKYTSNKNIEKLTSNTNREKPSQHIKNMNYISSNSTHKYLSIEDETLEINKHDEDIFYDALEEIQSSEDIFSDCSENFILDTADVSFDSSN